MEELSLELKNLSTEELDQLRDTMEEELEYLEHNSNIMNEFKHKFEVAVTSIDLISKMDFNMTPSLVKISNHIYAEGQIVKPSKVIVYLGDGYFAKLSLEEGKSYFKRKNDLLRGDMDLFEEKLNNKYSIFTAIEEEIDKNVNEEIEKAQEEFISKLPSSNSTLKVLEVCNENSD